MAIQLILMITCIWLDLVKSSATVCGVCNVEPVPHFQNKRITVGVLWTKTMTSRAECASRCSLFSLKKSFGYKASSGECVAYTVPLTALAAMTYSSESGFNMYSTCAPVNGGVNGWSSWSGSCTQTCGTSHTVSKTRSRTCTNPAPAHGGSDCTEPLSETSVFSCGLPACAVNGGVSGWSSWSGSCTQTCGTSHTVAKTRSRTCTNPAPAHGGSDCTEPLSETSVFNCGLPACTATSANFGTCSSTCSGTNIVCNDGLCVCDIMYIKLGSSCVQGCCSAGYGSGITLFRDTLTHRHKFIHGYSDGVVYSVQTVEACISLCLSESGFTCVTADYDHQSKICYLSTTPLYYRFSYYTSSGTNYHQIIRNCA